MKPVISLAAVALLFPSPGKALVLVHSRNYEALAFPEFAAETNPIVWDGAIAPVGQGSVAFGHFGTVTDPQIRAAEGSRLSWAFVGTSFEQFGETVSIGEGFSATGNAGLFHINFAADVVGAGFLGKPVYVVVGNGPSLLGSDLVVVFKSAFTFQDFQVVQANLNDQGFTLGELLLGKLGPAQVYYPTEPFFLAGLPLTGIHAARIPEPATALFGFLASGLACCRRGGRGQTPKRMRCTRGSKQQALLRHAHGATLDAPQAKAAPRS